MKPNLICQIGAWLIVKAASEGMGLYFNLTYNAKTGQAIVYADGEVLASFQEDDKGEIVSFYRFALPSDWVQELYELHAAA